MGRNRGVVYICRSPGDYTGGFYEAAKIKNVQWGKVSGGIHKVQNGWSLYGYIPYSDAANLVICSGQHNWGHNDARICITASENADNPDRQSAYYFLVEIADEKANCGIAAGCPNGAPSTTRRIRQIVGEQGEVCRGDLKKRLLDEGYTKEVIPKAIKNLYLQQVLSLTGDSRSSKQIIRLY